MSTAYDIQSGTAEGTGERGTWIVRKDSTNTGSVWTRIAQFLPGEYTEADEALLGNADALADALDGLRIKYGSDDPEIRFCDHAAAPCPRCDAAATALRAAGRLVTDAPKAPEKIP